MSEMTVRCICMRRVKGNRRKRAYHDRVDRRMEAQSFANDTVEDREFLHLLVCHGPKSSVGVGEMF